MQQSSLPPIPDQPLHNAFVLFGPTPAQLAWIVQSIYGALEVIEQKLETISQKDKLLMSTIADLTAASHALADQDHALTAEVTALHSSVENLITVFNSVKGGLNPADQSALDVAVAEVTSASADFATATGALSGTQADVDTANPPAAPVEPPVV